MQNEEMVDLVLASYKDDLEKAFEHIVTEYQQIRAGRANPHILDKVFVEYYGTMTPVSQMANIAVAEARMLTISVWDQSQVKNVAKAISVADLGVQPNDDGKIIRLVFPALTEERRKEIVKQIKKLMEDTKVVMRNSRRDALEEFKKMKNDKSLSEDEFASLEKDVQKQLDQKIQEIESLCATKEKEIMEI